MALSIQAEGEVEAINKLRATLNANVPLLLSAAAGIGDAAADASAAVTASIEGVQGAVKAGGAGALQAGACLAAAVKAQAEASVSISVSVKASASASGSVSSG